MRFNTYCLVPALVLLAYPHHRCLVHGATRGAGANADITTISSLLENDNIQRRHLMEDNNGGGNGDGVGAEGLDAPGPCLPASEVPDYILNHERTIASGCGRTNECLGGCCRLFSWSECDTDNSFPILQCICNANTGTNAPVPQPTPRPTPNPTISPPPTPFPTKGPTVNPTPQPTPPGTQSPTISPQPSNSPSKNPTPPPTTPEPSTSNPTGDPTMAPSAGPSGSPSDSPTGEPSVSPTTRPTASPSASPSSAPSETPSSSPSTSSPSSTPSESPSESPTIKPFNTADTTFEGSPVRQSTCLESPPAPQFVKKHTFTYTYEVYVTGGAVTASTVPAQQIVVDILNDPIHDAIARRFLQCTYEDADLWILQSAPQEVVETSTCRGSVLSSDSCFVVVAVESIYVYDVPGSNRRSRRILRKLQGEGANDDAAVQEVRTQINSFINNEMAAGTFNYASEISLAYVIDGSNPIVTQAPTTLSPTPTPTNAPVDAGPPVGGLGGGVEDSLSAAQGADGQVSEEQEGWPVAGIAALAVGCAVLLVVILLAISRSRSNRRERQLDYLDKADLEIMNQTMEDHLELDSNDQEGYDMDGMGAIRSSPESYPMEDDEFTSSSPKSGSPSRRSQRGPLHSQDELDKVVGNHRGQNTPQRSKRGRVYLSKDTVDL